MTQPCHEDTTLNQQCCNGKHITCNTRRRAEEQNPPALLPPHTTHRTTRAHTIPHHTPHNKSTHHRTSPPTTNTTPHKQKRNEDNIKRQGQYEGEAPVRTRGTTHNTPPPPFNETTTQTKGEGANTQTGKPVTLPPLTHYATHHHNRHPTIHNGPTHHHDKGRVNKGIPYHTMSEERYSPPAQCRTRQGTVHDMTVQYSQHALRVDGTGHTQWAGVDQ